MSLRANFAATLAGNILFAASQWAILSLIAKLGTPEMLGEYAYALAVVTPVALFSHLNLRAVLATDVEGKQPFGDYLVVRLATTAAGLAVITVLALASGARWPVLALGVVLSLDNLSDIYYGLLQRRERMDQIARSTTARGLLAMAAMGVVLAVTGSLLAGIVAMAVARSAVLLAYDRPVASRGESLTRSGLPAQARIFRTALPLGAGLMLSSLAVNMPRYAIEHRLGTAQLGAFAAVASFMTVGSTVVNALGQAATPRLARHFTEGDARKFRKLAWELMAIALLLGAAGVAAALVLGRFVLALVYRPAYAAHGGLLVWVMAAAVCSYLAGTLGYIITSARAFNAQVPLLIAVAGSSGLASWLMVPHIGLNGAAAALAVAAAVQIAGELLILRRSLQECDA